MADDRRRIADVEARYLFLGQAVVVCDPFMLAQVFQPAADDEAFNHKAGCPGVLEHIPSQGSVPFAHGLEAVQDADEISRSGGIDAILNQDHHRTAV